MERILGYINLARYRQNGVVDLNAAFDDYAKLINLAAASSEDGVKAAAMMVDWATKIQRIESRQISALAIVFGVYVAMSSAQIETLTKKVNAMDEQIKFLNGLHI